MKKLLALAIISSLIISYTMPAMAIEDTTTATVEKTNLKKVKKEKKKEKKFTPTQNKFDYINMNWWGNFDDDILNGYIIKAIENNKDLKMASLTIDEYYQSVKAQRAGELPSVYTGFLPAYGKLEKKESWNFMLPLIASYEVDLWGKNHNKTDSVKKVWEASILDEQAAYISIASAVGSTYINVVKLDAMIDLQEDIVKLRKEIYEIMDISNKEGLVSTSDLVKANKSYTLGVSDLTDLKKNRTKLLHQLAVLIGDSPNNIENYARCDYKTLGFKGVIPKTVNSEIILTRPDYLKAEKMLEKAGIDVKIARKEMFPTIILGGGVLFSNSSFKRLFDSAGMLWGLGGGLIQPAFLGGKLKANLKSKKIAYEKAVKNYEKVNLTSMQEVNDSLVSIKMDEERLEKQRKIYKLEISDFNISKNKYNEGVISKLDLDQMQENLLSVNKMLYATEFDCMVDYISYYKAVAAKA